MNIAVLSFYQKFVSRGVETFVHELSSRVDKDYNLKVYQPSPDLKPQKPKALKPNLLTYSYLDHHSQLIKKFTQQTLAQLQKNPPDVLMPLNNGWMSLLAKRFCQKNQTKLILPGFAGISWEDRLNLKLNPDCFVACSKYQADWGRKINPQAKIKTIYIGVNTDRFKPQGKKYNHKLKPPIILCIAGPQKYKRVDLAIQAAAQLNSVSFLLVGSQPRSIINLGRRLLGNRFKHIQVSYQDLDPVYRSADVFTLPSESNEAYGIVILEALASNLPVVVNRDPIRKELVGNLGLTVDPTDLDQYTQTLHQAITQSWADRPRQQALKFSWDKITQQYQQLWQSLTS